MRAAAAMLLTLLTLTGCGGGGDAGTPGGRDVPAAAPAHQDPAALLAAAGARPDPDDPGALLLSDGCWITLTLTAAQLPAYQGDPWVVLTPDGQAGVKISPRAGREAACLAATRAALQSR